MPHLSQTDFVESNAQPARREYGVFLVRGEDRRFEQIEAVTPDRAADMCAIRCGDGWRPIAVTVSRRWEIAGRCHRCNRWLLLPDDRPVETPAGLACRAC